MVDAGGLKKRLVEANGAPFGISARSSGVIARRVAAGSSPESRIVVAFGMARLRPDRMMYA